MTMSPSRCKAHILLVFLAFCPAHANAVNQKQCFDSVKNCAVDSSSQPCVLPISNTTIALSALRRSDGSSITTATDLSDATALSFPACVQYCGVGQKPFSWTVFSQEYASWLLPYLAMLSQLPFGAQRRADNFMSAILTLGSPMLAGYSLYVTLLNGRWVNVQLFAGINYPSADIRSYVVRVLTSLQQVPLRVHPGVSARFESLVVHPDNEDWWKTLSAELDYSHTWSIASAIAIIWVVFAYFLTVTDSFANVADNMNSNGQGTGSVWLWLLPIVVGWLVLSPKCDYARVQAAYDRANRQVFVADSHDHSAAPTQVRSNFGFTIYPDPNWKLSRKGIASPDEVRIPPIFNYARILAWSRAVYVTSLHYRAAWRKWNNRLGVDGKQIPPDAYDEVLRQSRMGTRDQTIRYCCPDGHEYPGSNVLWPRHVLFNMIIASLMSLQLQWGTAAAGVLVAWFTPTIGLGCRSLAYLLYGALSTFVWFLLVLSSLLGDYAHHLIYCSDTPGSDTLGSDTPGLESNGQRTLSTPVESTNTKSVRYAPAGQTYARTLARVADLLRWAGKLLAIINAIGIVANSIFQYANVYDNCYCDSSVFTWGSRAFNVISPLTSDIDLARKAWIGALALALASCAFFVGMIYLVTDTLPQ